MVIAQFERGSRAELPEALPVGKSRNMNRSAEAKPMNGMDLGEPLSVYDAARLIGCSAWTVRQKHVRAGLPCFRSGPSGRMIFYRNQVVAWIRERQKEQKGGSLL
jgi:hypothetical protein